MSINARQPGAGDADAQLAALGSETRVERGVKRVLPWVLSIAIHLCIAFAAVFVTWTVANLPQKEEATLIVADFNAMQYEPVAQTQVAATEALDSNPVIDFAPPTPSVEAVMQSLRAADDVDPMSLLAPGSSGAMSRGSAMGNFAPAPNMHQASFAGTSATNARKIVYVIDASGTMIHHLQFVVDELSRSLSNLSTQQRFAVIFFKGDEAIEVPPAGELNIASPAERQRVIEWIRSNVIPGNRTNPRRAIEKALHLKPDVIFLLSHGLTGHGEFEIDQGELLAWLDRRNPVDRVTGRRAIQINCIQFLDPDPLDTMKRIAEQHGGAKGYKFLSRRELGLGE